MSEVKWVSESSRELARSAISRGLPEGEVVSDGDVDELGSELEQTIELWFQRRFYPQRPNG